MFVRTLYACALVVSLMVTAVFGSQNPLFNPTTGTLSGLTQVQNDNNAFDSLNTCNSGGAAPSNQLSGVPSLGNCWIDTATTPYTVFVYDGSSWLPRGYIDATNHIFLSVTGGGVNTTVASATTTDLCSISNTYVTISGSATITSFGSSCVVGQIKFMKFATGITLTNSGSLLLPTSANIVTANGDTAIAIQISAGTWKVLFYQTLSGAALSTAGLNIGASALGNSALGMGEPINLGITTSVTSNALTVTITGANGSAPSSTNPVLIPFRSATLATGTPVMDSLQSSLSITVASGNTLGCSSGVACRPWIYAIDNGGTPAIGLMTCSSATAIFSCSDDLLYNTAAGTSGGSSNGVLYASTGSLSGKAVRIIGYLEATETTAGTWATTPSKVQLFGPGVAAPGKVVQGPIYFATASTTNCVTTGHTATAVLQAVTPSSAANLIRVNVQMQYIPGATLPVSEQISRGTSPTLIGEPFGFGVQNVAGAQFATAASGFAIDAPNTTSSTTYGVYCTSVGGTEPIGGGVITVDEIMGALEPANDSASVPLRMVG